MSSRHYTIAVIALVIIGAGTWWALSIRAQESKGSYALSIPGTSAEKSNPASPTPVLPVVVENNSSRSSPDEPVPGNETPPTTATWPPATLAFKERPDPDPALSREIEYVIKRSLAFLDAGRYEAESIQCRGQACQIRLIDRVPSAGTPRPSLAKPILDELKRASIRNPTTGVQLGLPKLNRLTFPRLSGETAGVIAVIEFPE